MNQLDIIMKYWKLNTMQTKKKSNQIRKVINFIDKAVLAILLCHEIPFRKIRRKLRRSTENKFLVNFFGHPFLTAKKFFAISEDTFCEWINFYIKAIKLLLSKPETFYNRKAIKNFIQRNAPLNNIRRAYPIDFGTVSITEFKYRKIPKEFEFKKSEKPLFSIVIPVYNQFMYTLACLYSILKHTEGIEYEIIIADDCSTDKTKNIHKYLKNIRIIKTPQNQGFLINCNNAIKHAKGEYICLLNNDMQVQPNWLDWMLKLFESEEKVGVVGGKILFNPNTLQEAGTIIYKDEYSQGRFDFPTKSQYSYVKEVDYVSGCCLVTPKKLWDKIGGFDEIYAPAYSEDPDYCYSVKKLGYKVLYQPKAVILHYESKSYNEKKVDLMDKNKKVFDAKWNKELSQKTDFDLRKIPFTGKTRPKTILVIDDKLPEYDQHAGAKTIFHFLKLFKKMGMHIKFLPADYRLIEPYASTLGQLGIEIITDCFMKDKDDFKEWLKLNYQFIDYALISRPQMAEQYLGLIKDYENIKTFYYGHDLHYLRELRRYELTKNAESLSSSNFFKSMEFDIFNQVDMSYYPSQVEADTIKNEIPEARVKAVPAYLYDISKAPEQKGFEEKKDLMFVGGFGHSPNVDGILWFVEEIFPKILQKQPNIKLNILGSNPTTEILGLQSNSINILGYVEDNILIEYYQDCKIVVAPLRFGAGVKGKIVESIYNQMPVITTSIGAEGIDYGDILTVADDPVDFADKLLDLYNNKERYEYIVQNSLNIIKKNFSYEKAMQIFSQDIDPTFRKNELVKE